MERDLRKKECQFIQLNSHFLVNVNNITHILNNDDKKFPYTIYYLNDKATNVDKGIFEELKKYILE